MINLETVSVYRGDTDRKGNAVKEPHGEVSVAFAWGGMSRSNGRFGREDSSETSPLIYVEKGSDLRARDRVQRSNGERYSVVGHPLWEQPNELSVFGRVWVVFQVESLNG